MRVDIIRDTSVESPNTFLISFDGKKVAKMTSRKMVDNLVVFHRNAKESGLLLRQPDIVIEELKSGRKIYHQEFLDVNDKNNRDKMAANIESLKGNYDELEAVPHDLIAKKRGFMARAMTAKIVSDTNQPSWVFTQMNKDINGEGRVLIIDGRYFLMSQVNDGVYIYFSIISDDNECVAMAMVPIAWYGLNWNWSMIIKTEFRRFAYVFTYGLMGYLFGYMLGGNSTKDSVSALIDYECKARYDEREFYGEEYAVRVHNSHWLPKNVPNFRKAWEKQQKLTHEAFIDRRFNSYQKFAKLALVAAGEVASRVDTGDSIEFVIEDMRKRAKAGEKYPVWKYARIIIRTVLILAIVSMLARYVVTGKWSFLFWDF